MNDDFDTPDTLRTDLDSLLGGMPPLGPLPEGFAAAARRRRRRKIAVTGAGGVLALAAVGVGVAVALPSHDGASRLSPAGPSSTSPGPSVAPSHTAPAPGHTASAAAATHAPASPASTGTGSSAAGSVGDVCTVSQLRLSFGRPNGAAGSAYYPLLFTNTSSVSCQLGGYPGVSFVSASGRQVGAAATRDPLNPATTVTLAPGGVASATVQVTDPLNYPPTLCALTPVAGLRIYPPGSIASVVVDEGSFSGQACSTQSHQLSVTTLVAGPSGLAP